jgi:hypothetical protein
MRRATLDEIRRLVAGGIRWAHENGMRLPKDWVKPASLLGGIDDWMTADVSRFVKEFAGHPDDLRQRLIGEPFESYIQRDDIDIDFFDLAPYKDQNTGEYVNNDDDDDDVDLADLDEDELEEIAADIPEEELNELAAGLTPIAMGLASETNVWLSTRNEEPSIGLVEAWQSILLSSLLARTAMPDAPDEEIADFGIELLEDMSKRIDASRQSKYEEAVGQALEHLDADPMMIQNAMLKYAQANASGEQEVGE